MVMTEVLLDRTTETVPAATDLLAIVGPYDDYWQQFANLSGQECRQEAWHNAVKEKDLAVRLYNPKARTHNRYVDSLSEADVAEEWYLGLGSFNKLNGASPALLLAAGILWENPTKTQAIDHDLVTRFITEVGTIRHKQIPERMQRALQDDIKLAHLNLTGQVLLDIARIPDTDHMSERIFAADLAYQVNHGLTDLLMEQQKLTPAQERALSDALKAKFEARFEILSLKKASGELSNDDYQELSTRVLAEQVSETLRAANKMTNGDLYEHYFLTLARYALNTWPGQNRYEVRAATRRQDSPHDGFISKRLPKFAIDAQITDITGEEVDRLIQLKTNHEIDMLLYARGIIPLDDILLQDTSNAEMHQEMTTGLGQMLGLIREVLVGQMYTGNDDVIHRHINTARQSLGIN
jgi:hypothetical protein